ncbi:hypothetical protein DMJ13_27290 [halophilic archaeon]|nr:hypothetical protein DMJ13_27290 [halophilic archaeon]
MSKTKFVYVPTYVDTKERVEKLRYDMRVDSMDAVVRELLRVYDECECESPHSTDGATAHEAPSD